MKEKTAAIIVIGNEILTGKSHDKNANFLIGELYRLGVALRRVVTIPDEVDQIVGAVRECLQFDHVFTSGGIGPTHDDVTIEGIAAAFDRKVIRHPELEKMLRGHFGDDIDEARLRLADVPDGAHLITGPGIRWPVLAVENVYILPGVPEHFRGKFEAIRERFRVEPYFIRSIYTMEDEFDIAPRLTELALMHPAVDVGSYPSFSSDEYRVKITIESKDGAEVQSAVDDLMKALNPSLVGRTE